jgi:tetratricopeptide (TPR) repeat protein
MGKDGQLDAPHPSKTRSRKLVRFSVLLILILSFVTVAGCGRARLTNRRDDPLSAQEHWTLGSIYEKRGETDLALREYEAALERDSRFLPAMIRLAELSYGMAEYGQAERYYRKAIKLAPRNGDLYNNLCWVYISQGKKLKRAESLIMRAMELNPEHRGYYLDTLGAIYLEEHRYRDAIKALEAAASFFDEMQPELLGQVYRHLGLAYDGIGERSKAKEALKKARDLLGR